MKTKNVKRLLTILGISMSMLIVLPTSSKAVLQAKPGQTSLSGTADDFFVKIREMEAEGGTLGLKAVINYGDDKTAGTYLDSSNNGVDVHMAKNTEWGTVALLAASQFGSIPESAKGDITTTGNDTGVYQMADGRYEYTATTYRGTTNTSNKILRLADSRYYNIYTTSSEKITGDALTCSGWRGATNYSYTSTTYPVFERNNKALFGYSAYDAIFTHAARAALVVASGL